MLCACILSGRKSVMYTCTFVTARPAAVVFALNFFDIWIDACTYMHHNVIMVHSPTYPH